MTEKNLAKDKSDSGKKEDIAKADREQAASSSQGGLVSDAEKSSSEQTEEEKNKEREVPAKFKDLVKKIEELNVSELAELVKVLEDRFGVSAGPMMAAPAAAPSVSGSGEAVAEKSSFDLELKSGGDQKIAVIKLVKEITGQGLKEAKDLVDGAPRVIKQGLKKEEAEEIKKKLEEAGATVELK